MNVGWRLFCLEVERGLRVLSGIGFLGRGGPHTGTSQASYDRSSCLFSMLFRCQVSLHTAEVGFTFREEVPGARYPTHYGPQMKTARSCCAFMKLRRKVLPGCPTILELLHTQSGRASYLTLLLLALEQYPAHWSALWFYEELLDLSIRRPVCAESSLPAATPLHGVESARHTAAS